MSCRSAFETANTGVFDDFSLPVTAIRNPSLYPAELRVQVIKQYVLANIHLLHVLQ